MTPPALLLHGLGGCGYEWSLVAAAMEPGRARAHDLPFHGGRSDPGPAHLDVLVHDAATASLRLADRRGSDAVVLGGFSLGATVALRLLAERPGTVAGALLVAPVLPSRSEGPNPLAKLGRIARQRGLAFAWDVISRLPPIGGWSDAHRSAYGERFLAFCPEAFSAAVTEIPASCASVAIDLDALRRAGRPLRVVGWGGDRMHPPGDAVALADALGATLTMLPARPADLDAETAFLVDQMHELDR